MKRHKILIIGNAPGPNTDGSWPLHPHTETGAAARLRDLMGWSTDRYLQGTIRFNANDDQGNALNAKEAQSRVSGLLSGFDGRLIIFLGRGAASRSPVTKNLAFGEVHEDGIGRRFLVLPHTSGRNRFWNDPQARSNIRAVLLAELLRVKG